MKTANVLAGLLIVLAAGTAAYVAYYAMRYGEDAITPLEAAIRARHHARRTLDTELDKILSREQDDFK